MLTAYSTLDELPKDWNDTEQAKKMCKSKVKGILKSLEELGYKTQLQCSYRHYSGYSPVGLDIGDVIVERPHGYVFTFGEFYNDESPRVASCTTSSYSNLGYSAYADFYIKTPDDAEVRQVIKDWEGSCGTVSSSAYSLKQLGEIIHDPNRPNWRYARRESETITTVLVKQFSVRLKPEDDY